MASDQVVAKGQEQEFLVALMVADKAVLAVVAALAPVGFPPATPANNKQRKIRKNAMPCSSKCSRWN